MVSTTYKGVCVVAEEQIDAVFHLLDGHDSNCSFTKTVFHTWVLCML